MIKETNHRTSQQSFAKIKDFTPAKLSPITSHINQNENYNCSTSCFSIYII